MADPERSDPLLVVDSLEVSFASARGRADVVRGVSFQVGRGEIVAVVGESGSGKSMTALTVMGLQDRSATVRGTVSFDGADLTDPRRARSVRGHGIGIVFQDPMTSLNPVLTVREQMLEPLRHHRGLSRRDATTQAVELLTMVGIHDAGRRIDAYPGELSGGMRQRVMIAMALAADPALLIMDEPTTALDVTVQQEIVLLIRRMRDQLGVSVVWITHDLALLASIADRVMVMYAGRIVETGPSRDIYHSARHPYTSGLLGSLTSVATDRATRLTAIPGSPPVPGSVPAGCPFRTRCAHVTDACHTEPPLVEVTDRHCAACWLVEGGVGG